MMFKSTLQFCLSAVLLASLATAQKILLTNDDGWAVAQIRAQYDAFRAAGYDVVLSAPAENASGTGSISLPAIPLLIPCEYDSCPAFSPAYGFNASDPRMNYVNAFPADSARHGIQTLSSKFFDSAPDVVVSGPNVGGNTGIEVVGSGTVGAACEGSKQGIPSIAFSGHGSSSVSYTTLTSDPNSSASIAAVNNAQISVNFLRALFESNSSLILPSGTILNVNFPFLGGEGCTSPSDVKWVLTRAFPVILPFSHPDVEVCGNNGKLPEEGDVIDGGGCRGSVSVIDAILKFDAGKSAQEAVLKSLSALDFVCFSG